MIDWIILLVVIVCLARWENHRDAQQLPIAYLPKGMVLTSGQLALLVEAALKKGSALTEVEARQVLTQA